MRIWDRYIDDDIRKMYQHYRSEPKIGSNPCLLLIDLYNLSYKGGDRPVSELLETNPSGCGEHAYRAIEPTQQLIEMFRALDYSIIYTTRDWAAHASGMHSTQRQRKDVSESDYQIFDAFRPQPTDAIIKKSRASVFYKTKLDEVIMERNIDSIVVGGESTSGCVRASVVDAYSRGLPPILVTECIFDRNPVSHAINLFDMHHKYGHVTTLKELNNLLISHKGEKQKE